MISESAGILDLTCSIVLYKTDKEELLKALSCVLAAKLKVKVYLIDNSPTTILNSVVSTDTRIEYLHNGNNVGYGSGHNIAIKKSEGLSKYHLILNADVEFNSVILEKAFKLLENNPNVSLVSPKVLSPDGAHLPFCRMLPTPFDLFARRFLPGFMKDFLIKKLNNYLMLFSTYESPMNIPNLPGCFMFARTEVLNHLNGFDENFFMYVEDVDLTRRIYENSECIYYPEISIIHGLARGSAKFSLLMLYHMKSAIYYFNKWGWFYDKERNKINKHLMKTYYENSDVKDSLIHPVEGRSTTIEAEVKVNKSNNGVASEKIRLGAAEVVAQSHYI